MTSGSCGRALIRLLPTWHPVLGDWTPYIGSVEFPLYDAFDSDFQWDASGIIRGHRDL